MIYFVILLTASIACVGCSIPPAPLHSWREFIQRDPCVKRCTEDCTGIYLCFGEEQITVDCKTQTGKLYCNADTLTCDNDPDHCEAIGGNLCNIGTGFHPDIMNCRKFYYCESSAEQPINYHCDGSTVYDPNKGQCATGLRCYDFTETGLCKNQQGKLIPHPLDKTYYVLCQTPKPKLFKCKNGYVFDPSTIGCQFVCTETGRFPDEYDDSHKQYYECVRSGNSWLTYHKTCPNGTTFDPNSKLCKH